MGEKAKILLVILCLVLFLICILIVSKGSFDKCMPSKLHPAEYSDFYQHHGFQVDATHFRQFWRWPNAKLPQGLQIERLYFLQASWHQPGLWVDHQAYATKLQHINHCVLVYRLETLADASEIVPKIKSDIDRWQSQGNRISGIQFDFDSGTNVLESYADFLATARRLLPKEITLSVTGLMDWGNSATDNLSSVQQATDEIIFQTYQGKKTLPHLRPYFKKILAKKIDFKVGLVDGGSIDPNDFTDVLSSAHFKGFVIFMFE
jgi:hypothetical protein